MVEKQSYPQLTLKFAGLRLNRRFPYLSFSLSSFRTYDMIPVFCWSRLFGASPTRIPFVIWNFQWTDCPSQWNEVPKGWNAESTGCLTRTYCKELHRFPKLVWPATLKMGATSLAGLILYIRPALMVRFATFPSFCWCHFRHGIKLQLIQTCWGLLYFFCFFFPPRCPHTYRLSISANSICCTFTWLDRNCRRRSDSREELKSSE